MSFGNALVMAGLAVVGVAMLSPSLKNGARPPSQADVPLAAGASPLKPGETGGVGNGLAHRELMRGPDGHFYADAQVNGATVRFLVDTGATVVVLTPADAQRAGIALPSERALAMGVGGTVEVAPVTIDRIAIGPLEARAVRAAVAEQLPVSLLGQTYLSQIGTVEISGDRMVLR